MRSQIAKSLSVDDLHGRFRAPPWECKHFNNSSFFLCVCDVVVVLPASVFHRETAAQKKKQNSRSLFCVCVDSKKWKKHLDLLTTLYCDYYERGFPFIYFFFMATAEERGFAVASIERGKSFKKIHGPFPFFFLLLFLLDFTAGSFFTLPVLFFFTYAGRESGCFFFFWISKWDYYDRLPDGWTASATRFPSHFLKLKLFVVPRRVMNKHHGIVLHVDGGDMVLVCTDLPFVFSPPSPLFI